MSLRDDFEEWFASINPDALFDRNQRGDYFWPVVQKSWALYQAATERAVRIVEAHKKIASHYADPAAHDLAIDIERDIKDES